MPYVGALITLEVVQESGDKERLTIGKCDKNESWKNGDQYRPSQCLQGDYNKLMLALI